VTTAETLAMWSTTITKGKSISPKTMDSVKGQQQSVRLEK
jgi:hypothetical protein